GPVYVRLPGKDRVRDHQRGVRRDGPLCLVVGARQREGHETARRGREAPRRGTGNGQVRLSLRQMIWNKDVETMPRPALRELQLERLRWSVQWAYDRVPFHRRRLAAAGVASERIRSLDDLRRLPFMVKSDLREHYPDGLF